MRVFIMSFLLVCCTVEIKASDLALRFFTHHFSKEPPSSLLGSPYFYPPFKAKSLLAITYPVPEEIKIIVEDAGEIEEEVVSRHAEDISLSEIKRILSHEDSGKGIEKVKKFYLAHLYDLIVKNKVHSLKELKLKVKEPYEALEVLDAWMEGFFKKIDDEEEIDTLSLNGTPARYLVTTAEKILRERYKGKDEALDNLFDLIVVKGVDSLEKLKIDLPYARIFEVEHCVESLKKIIDEGQVGTLSYKGSAVSYLMATAERILKQWNDEFYFEISEEEQKRFEEAEFEVMSFQLFLELRMANKVKSKPEFQEFLERENLTDYEKLKIYVLKMRSNQRVF